MKPRTTVVAALAALLVAGRSSATGSTASHDATGVPATSSSTTVAQAAPQGVEAAIAAVPWSEVGPGWTLATWSPVTGTAPGVEQPPGEPKWGEATTTLYLVDPAGGRYAITDFPPPGESACGVVYLAKLNADGTTSPVSVPGVESDSVVVIGVNGDNLHLQARASCGHCAETIHRPPLGANCRLTQLDGDRAASEIASAAIGLAAFE